MPGYNKSNRATFEKRVNIILEMILSGLKRWQIIQNISNHDELKKWKVDPRQIDNYIRRANDLIKDSIENDRAILIAKANAKYEFLYQKLVNVKDYKGALAAIEKTVSLHGLNAPINHNIEFDSDITVTIGVKKIDKE